MKCTEFDTDLLLHGLGELPYWRSWNISRHLQRCPACRERQRKLSRAAAGFADVLQPSSGGPRFPLPPVTVAQGWFLLASLLIVMLTSATLVGISGYKYIRARGIASVPCRPDLPNDLCR